MLGRLQHLTFQTASSLLMPMFNNCHIADSVRLIIAQGNFTTCMMPHTVGLLYLHDYMPCSVSAARWKGVCRYATHVHEALTGLAADPDQEVRRLMALQFHDICKMLGKERCAQYMKR